MLPRSGVKRFLLVTLGITGLYLALNALWLALTPSLVALFDARDGRPLVYVITLVAMWVLGLINAFVHGKDAWASMPAGLYLSAVVALLSLVAAWIGYSGLPTRRVQ